MGKRVVLVGHCGPDSSFLRLAVKKAIADSQIASADDAQALHVELKRGVDLLLVNRVLDYGFATSEGVELIRQLKSADPNVRAMLVSNYPEAQQAAVAAGALPGFGKSELNKPDVLARLAEALL